MSRRSLPILLVLLAVLAIGIVWLIGTVQVESAPVAEAAAPAAQPDRPEPNAPAPSLADAPPRDAPAAADIESASAPVAREAIEADADGIDLTDGWTVEGRVQFPPGTPGDERVAVLASVGKSRLGKIHSRSDLGADGSFRVTFAKSAKKGHLLLEARYLYLTIAHEISPDDLAKLGGRIVLRPELGGCIRGRLELARNALDRRASLADARINLYGQSKADQSDFSNHVNRDAKVGEDLEFEIGGLSPSLTYSLSCMPEDLVGAHRQDLQVAAGRTVAADLVIRLGARVTGRVVDEQGTPVEGVEVGMTVRKGRSSSNMQGRETTPADGTFTVGGIDSGKVSLTFSKTGFTYLEKEMGLLADGDARSGLEVLLQRGRSVSGRVLWPDGSPAAAARIDYRFTREDGDPKFRFNSTESQQIKAGDDGAFEISGLGSSKLAITAQADVDEEGKPAKVEEDAEEPKAAKKRKKTSWKAHLEDVAPDTRDLTITLQKGAIVRGRAVDDQGTALAGFTVRAEPVDGSQVWERRQRAVTGKGADGEFALDGLHDGEWDLVAEAKQHASSSSQRVRVPGEDAELVMVLPRGAKISGVVVDRAGNPVKGARATARPADAASQFNSWERKEPSGKSDADGRFEIDGVSPGPVKVSATADGMAASAPLPVEVAPGQVVGDLTLTLRVPGRITGEVLDDAGRPMAGRQIHANGMQEQQRYRDTRTDAAGRFELDEVTPDRYWVSSQPSREELDALALDESESNKAWRKGHKQASVEVKEGETVHVVLGGTPKDGVRVHGTIYAGAAKDRTVPDRSLWIHGRKSADPSPISGTSDAQGRYEVVVPAAGEYSVSVMDEERGTTNSTKVTVPEGKSFEHDIVLPGGRLAGRVIGVDGGPAAGVQVHCSPDSMFAAVSSDASYGNSTTDKAGAFSFDNMGAGTYRFEAGERLWQEDAGKAGKCVLGGVVLAADASVENLELRLQPQCRVEGVVIGPDGNPAAGASVYARDEQGNVVQRWPPVSADASGRFTMDSLLPGKVTFAARTRTLASGESAPVTVRSEETAKVELEMRRGTRLRVLVRGDDDRLVGAFASIADASGKDVTMIYAYHETTFFGPKSEGEGQLIGPVPPGRYRLTAANHDKKTASQEVSVSGEEEVLVTIQLGG